MPDVPDEKKKKKRSKSPSADDEDTGTLDNTKSTFEILDPSYGVHTTEALKRMNESEIPLDLIETLLVDIQSKGAEGAVLIFLPGWQLISMLLSRLEAHPIFGLKDKCLILPLHSQLTGKEQHRVFEKVPPGVRKVLFLFVNRIFYICFSDYFVHEYCRNFCYH